MPTQQDILVYLIAGEPSGDLLASRLMKALNQATNGKVLFQGVGGETMTELGFKSLFDASELAVMGLAEVVPSIPRIMARIRQTVDDIKEKKPDVVITVDSWSFSARVNRGLKSLNLGIPQIHYVAPQVWAWKKKRAKTCGKYIDRLMSLLPFEADFFTPYGVDVDYVGHPVVEGGALLGDGVKFRTQHNIPTDAPVLCVLPGSRRSETKYLLPVFKESIAKLALKYPDMHIVIPTVVTVEKQVREAVKDWVLNVTVVTGQENRYDAFAASQVAMAASGTVALELAMVKVPYLIGYKMNPVTSMLVKLLVTGKYANLVNILAKKEIVKEFLLQNCNADALTAEIQHLLEDSSYRTEQTTQAYKILELLGAGQAQTPSQKAGKVVLDAISLSKSKKK